MTHSIHPPEGENRTVAPPDGRSELALVMGGGGARAAYQVGVLRAIARARPELRIPILTGVSAGAINAAHLAAHPGNLLASVEALADFWTGLDVEQVFRVDAPHLARNGVRWLVQLLSGGLRREPAVRGLVDTAPLRGFLESALGAPGDEIPGIAANLARGRLKALALSGSSYGTGHSVTWVQGREIRNWERPLRRSDRTRIGVRHIMASAALPLIFPAVEVDGEWFGDGGIRLTAPLSPALHLGADRILAVSTRSVAPGAHRGEPGPSPQVRSGYPAPAQVAGNLLDAVFLDVLDQDALLLQRINGLVRQLPPESCDGLRPVQLRVVRPSRNLAGLAGRFEPRLPRAFRFLSRGLGTRPQRSPDLLSLILFQPDYTRLLLELGEEDASRQLDSLLGFLADG